MTGFGTFGLLFNDLTTSLVSKLQREIRSAWGYQDEVRDLESRVDAIKNVLLDAEAKRELSHQSQLYIEQLKNVVYDADDLFDELRKQQLGDALTMSGKVRDFLSPNNPLIVAFTISHKVRRIRRTVDAFADNQRRFGLFVDREPVRRRREETFSYVYARDVIGREDNVEAVVNLLLDSDTVDDVSFVSIVGMGGLGKTTLAQLVFNHARVRDEFDSRLWVCVSDVGQNRFDVKAILAKILESATGGGKFHDLTIDMVANLVRQKLQGKKFLLILDDFWNENRSEWCKLMSLIINGGRGSRVVVTTCSKEVARIVGTHMYELKSLSPEDSWHLFETVAFEKGQGHDPDPELVVIGKKIVEKCGGVPLAIKVVGKLLFGQRSQKWLSFQENDVAKIVRDEDIMSMLKISYDNLETPLKSCFTYCALFPKDFVVPKELLISLWMAQNFIVPFYQGQGIEDAAEDCFFILLRRGFLDVVSEDEYGAIVSCKVQNLMHEVAQQVAGKEICVANSLTNNLAEEVRHVFYAEGGHRGIFSSKTKIRSYIRGSSYGPLPEVNLVASWMCLRALDLHNFHIKKLTDSVGKLFHLRYLDLSYNHDLKTLPSSLTKLLNLQTLNLRNCSRLKELPKHLSKLVQLRSLDIVGCKLICMPTDMGKLTLLSVLTAFFVADGSSSRKQRVSQLEELKALWHLRGSIHISIPENFTDSRDNNRAEGYVRGMQHLTAICISFLGSCIEEADDGTVVKHEALLAKLCPHPNLRELIVRGYQGATIQRWGSGDNWATSLPNLVKIELRSCKGLQHLPFLSGLPHLKSLELHNLTNLEYIKNTIIANSSAPVSGSADLTFFPSLEYLSIWGLPKLKGWWQGVGYDGDQLTDSSLRAFLRLSTLVIQHCPNLMSFPSCQNLKTLCLRRSCDRLSIRIPIDDIGFVASSSSHQANHHIQLREIEIDDVSYLKSLPTGGLTMIHINCAEELESLSEVGEVLKSCSVLRSLKIKDCLKLRQLSRGLEHLTALESLSICNSPELTFSEQDDDYTSWRSLHQSLHSLELEQLENMVVLPKGMQHLITLQNLAICHCRNLKDLPKWISCLSSLQSLRIISCNDLKSLPEAMQKLTSLQRLEIEGCPHLLTRCRNPNGRDWPKIQHISSICIKE